LKKISKQDGPTIFVWLIITFMIHNEAHYVACNITFLKNAEIVFSVDNSTPNS